MADAQDKKVARLRLAKKIGLIVFGLFILYLAAGFLVVPPLLKPKLEEALSKALGRQVTISEIKLNPLVLSSTISRLSIHEKDGQPFAGFEELYANAQMSSLFKWAFTVREIRVQGPFGILKLLPGNTLNIDDMLARWPGPKPEPMQEAAGRPRAIIDRFQVVDGRAAVENLTGAEPIREEIKPISFTLENLNTLTGREGDYHLEGIGATGDRYALCGRLTVNPVRIQGSYIIDGARISHYWKHLEDIVSFQIISGSTGMSGDYTVEIVDGQLNARLENGTFTLDDFKLVEKGKEEVLVDVPALTVKGIGVDLQARSINVERIQSADARCRSWLSPEGVFEHQRLFLRDLETLMKRKKSEAPEPDSTPAQSWQAALKQVELKNWGLVFEDRTLSSPAKLSADNLDVFVENLTNQKGKAAALGVTMRLNQAGDIKLKGTVGMAPSLQADLNVVTAKIALRPFQPYADDAVNVQIVAGTTSSKGRIRYRGQDAQPQIRYEGELSVDDVEIQDRLHAQDFITLVQLKTNGIGLELRPNKLNVAQVLIDRPHARVTIDETGVVNVVNAFASAGNDKTKKRPEDLLKRLVNFLILQFNGPMPMRVDRVRLNTFTADFVDASISPSYETHMEIAGATATGLSSAPSAKADFTFNGTIDETATFKGSGQMNPMNALQYSQADVSLKGFALKPTSPYSGKFIGFKIDQGTLHMDLKYRIVDDAVDGNNVIIVDQLALGEPVDSPDALNLPIKLGVTLLKDSDGRIKVQVPVEGNVKYPHFDFAKAITSALTGTIEDAGSAPFAAISAVDGFTGEELSRIGFAFGFSDLQDREIQKLNALASLLKERDALALGIMGTADRRMDGAAILGESPATGPPVDESTSNEKTPSERVSDQVADDERLGKLAQRRAEKVSAYLVDQAGIDAARIEVKPVQIKPEPDGGIGLVQFSLTAN